MKLNNFKYSDLKWIVINLPTRPDRLEETVQEFQRIGVAEYAHVQALDGKLFEPCWPEGLHNVGARGCLESHIVTLEAIAAIGDTDAAYVICEDDVRFTANFKQDMFPLLPYVDFSISPLHYIGANNLENIKLRPINDRLWRARGLFATHCYMVHASTAGRLAEYLKQRTHYVDVMYAQLQESEVITCFDAPYAFQRPSYSDILKSKVYHDIKGWTY
jgi:GR25 family glycosyltransferase involved in LPS biosynthesis